MPRFIFLSGAECGDVDSVVAFGLMFARGVPVAVSDEHAIGKLRGNRFFREVPGGDGDGDGDDKPSLPRRGRRADG